MLSILISSMNSWLHSGVLVPRHGLVVLHQRLLHIWCVV